MSYGAPNLEQISKLLADGSEQSIRYTALELRMCLEELAYDLLKLYMKHLPGDVVDTWQPPRVIDTVAEYDPNIEEDYTLSIRVEGVENAKPVCLGRHEGVSGAFIKKHYHKLSSYLHVPTIRQRERSEPNIKCLRAYIEELLPEVKRLFSSTARFAPAKTLEFHCPSCRTHLVRNIRILEKDPFMVCTEPTCRARYECRETGGDWSVGIHRVDVTCPSCETQTPEDGVILKEGSMYRCKHCGGRFRIVRKWTLKPEETAG